MRDVWTTVCTDKKDLYTKGMAGNMKEVFRGLVRMAVGVGWVVFAIIAVLVAAVLHLIGVTKE